MIVVAIALTVLYVVAGVLAALGVAPVHPGGYLFLWGALGWGLWLGFVFDRQMGGV